ncbi:MAG: hypothetical protein JWM35_2030 [Verrucomicrobia bacterium]|nr:hypothetical protein [Verrucomicrobiota bacterium]
MELERCAERFPLRRKARAFSAYDHFATMVFAQLTYRQSLRDIEACLNARPDQLYHNGIRGRVSRSNLAYANEHRSWQVFAAAAAVLMRRARRLACATPSANGIDADIFAFDASLIDLSLALCPWAHRQQSQAAVRLNVLLDTQLELPVFCSVTAGDKHEVAGLDEVPLHPGAFYIMDRGYVDFARLHRLHTGGVFFVLRAKSNLRFRLLRSTKVDRSSGLRCDQLIRLTRRRSARGYPHHLRRIRYCDPTQQRSFVFLTNHPTLAALAVTELYRRRWQVELFFRWIKQHLRLRWFFATSPNGVRVQIWSALCAHLLVAIAQQRLSLDASLYQILQVVSVSIWGKSPLSELLTKPAPTVLDSHSPKQLHFSGF